MERCMWDKMAHLTTVGKIMQLLYFTAHVLLMALVSLVGCVIAQDGRLELTDIHIHSHTPDQVL